MAATTTCPACGSDAFVAATGTCGRCGYASGELNRCPHCGAVARVEGTGDKAVCAVCGGPRVPGNYGGEAATDALKEQKKHLGAARIASISTVLQGIGATLLALFGLAIGPVTLTGKVLFFAVALIPLLLALRSRSRATAARTKAAEASDKAWQAAAEEVASRAKEGITASVLAKTLGVEPDRAERLLTTLTVHDRARIDVGDDAEVRYSVAPQVRVDDTELFGERPLEDESASADAPPEGARALVKEP